MTCFLLRDCSILLKKELQGNLPPRTVELLRAYFSGCFIACVMLEVRTAPARIEYTTCFSHGMGLAVARNIEVALDSLGSI